ncbi:PREDICTED: uncharacterized protein LOC104820745 isoform X2 [Tarenaya hassleriana]|uniref:uncharacterized protein LOC104820745 isoform X2 n=1 Tax=Tarenaya hassleriana TaxID=28532 RepID=UPI00053C5AB4|nr:PREDICTED: uncharacterized protein LOC104820745 isoform X2 [Tarenaya hassleriana]
MFLHASSRFTFPIFFQICDLPPTHPFPHQTLVFLFFLDSWLCVRPLLLLFSVESGKGKYDYYGKKSGQIPRFGEWEDANEMPITQYFENARQAGLLRDNTAHIHTSSSSSSSSSAEALKASSYYSHGRPRTLPPSRQTVAAGATKEKRGPQQQRRVRDVSGHAGKQYAYGSEAKHYQNDAVVRPSRPKPVDEDLYKIPPELLHSSKRKRMPGLLSCLVPCAS